MRAQGWMQVLMGLTAVVALAACEEQEVSIQIVQMEVDGQCLLQATAAAGSTTALGGGVVDLATTTHYAVFPRVINNMLNITEVKQFGVTDGRIDTHDVVLQKAIVRYDGLDLLEANIGEVLPVPLSGTIPVNGSAIIGLTAFTPAMIEEMRAAPQFLVFDADGNARAVRTSVELRLRITLHGKTLDGTEVKTNEFIFPVRVCNGCLVRYPAQAVDISAPVVPNCLRLTFEEGETSIAEDRQSCQLPGTDNNTVDCRECPGLAVDAVSRQLCQPPVSPVQ